MAKRATTEDLLARLRTLRDAPADARRQAALRDILAAPALHGIVLKMAAALAADSAAALADDLARALRSLLGADAAKRDPGCEGKTAAARALLQSDARNPDLDELFLALAAYRQMEAAYPRSIDTAGELRGIAALALPRIDIPDALFRLVDLLTDPLAITRQHAASALGMWGGLEAAPLLRLKARLGDEDPDVLGETLAALLRQSAADHRSFVAGFLEHADTRFIEMAALALGQSRDPDALPLLTEACTRLRGSPVGSTLFMAIGLLRTDAALDWLAGTLAAARPREAGAILDALAAYRRDDRLRARLAALTEKRPDLAPAIADWQAAS